MDIQAYISSGVLEAYVSGAATEKERREVQCLSSIHPEIAEELQRLEETMLQYAKAHAVPPPSHIRDSVMKNIGAPEVIPIGSGTAMPPPASQPRSNTGWRIAASVALLIASGFMVLFLQNRSDIGAMQQQMASLNEDRATLLAKIDALSSSLETSQEALAFLQDRNTQQVVMNGLPDKSPESYATVFWNAETNAAYLNVGFLPEPPTDKQYQLWAIVDGQPADMGVIEVTAGDALVSLPAIAGAQAFAVTLEPKGGSAQPTLEEMYVVGEV